MLTIAGATGRVGGEVANSLLMQREDVRVLVRTGEAAEGWRALGAEAVVVDLRDAGAVTRALVRSTSCFVLVPEDPTIAEFRATRRELADALAQGIAAARVPHVVLLSSVAAPLGAGPAAELGYAETVLAATGSTLTVLRACYFQDNIAASAAVASSRGVFPSCFASGDVVIPMVAIRDVAEVAAACLRDPPARSEVIDVLGPSYAIRDAVAELGAAIGTPVELVTIPAEGQPAALREAGVQAELAAALIDLHAALSAGAVIPQGDRVVTGPTPLAHTLARAVASHRHVDRRTIPAIVTALCDAWNRHDLVAMGELYVADAEFVNIFGGHLRGRDEIVREHAARHEVMFARARMSSAAPMIRMLTPTLGLARVEWTMTGITGADGRPAGDRAGLMLHVLERIGDAWWIVTTQNTEVSQQMPRRFLDRHASPA